MVEGPLRGYPGLTKKDVEILKKEFGDHYLPRSQRENLLIKANKVIEKIEGMIESREGINQGSVNRLRNIRWEIQEGGKE